MAAFQNLGMAVKMQTRGNQKILNRAKEKDGFSERGQQKSGFDSVGQGLANAVNGFQKNIRKLSNTPPQLPTTNFYVAIDGKREGPFAYEAIENMVSNGDYSGEYPYLEEGFGRLGKSK